MPLSVELFHTGGQYARFVRDHLAHEAGRPVVEHVLPVDLPDSEESGLRDAWKLLEKIKGIGFVKLTEKDIVRHRLVQDIVRAYDTPK